MNSNELINRSGFCIFCVCSITIFMLNKVKIFTIIIIVSLCILVFRGNDKHKSLYFNRSVTKIHCDI